MVGDAQGMCPRVHRRVRLVRPAAARRSGASASVTRSAIGRFAALAAFATFVARGAAAAPTRIRLRGSAHIDAHGARSEGEELVLRGVLQDDAAAPLPREPIMLSVARASAPGQVVTLGDGARAPRSCAPGGHDVRPAEGSALAVTTDDAGRFCVRVPLAVDRYVAHVVWGGSTLVDGAKVDVPIDMSRRALTLRFEPEPRIVWVSADGARRGVPPTSVEAVAMIEDDGATTPGAGLALALTNERGALLASGHAGATGHVRFAIDPTAAGPAGRGELRVSFAGNADTASTTHVSEIERHVRVELALAQPESGAGTEPDRLAPGSPDEGVAFVVAVRSPSGDVPNGSVEARVGTMLVGAANVERGRASVVVTFAAEARGSAPPAAGNDVPIVLRYAPVAPWYEPGDELTVTLPVRGPSPWRQAPLVLAGLAVIAWFVVGRAPRKAEPASTARRPKPISRGEAKVEIVRLAKDPRTGWSGRIVDAHDAEPVQDARITITRPAFGSAEVVAEALSGADGRFELGADARAVAGDELVVTAPLHATLRRPAPPSGELDVALVLRKRALLARLVAWARQRGRPFDTRPEPTPGHVRRQAGNDFNLARWADAVERAAFGGDAVDAGVEEEIDRIAPGASPASPVVFGGSPPPSSTAAMPDTPGRTPRASPGVAAPPEDRHGGLTPKPPKQGI